MGSLRLLSILAATASIGLAPSLASAEPTWVGDFETGDLSQWWLSAQVIGNAEKITVTEEVVREGSYAGRLELGDGDYSPSGHERNELVYAPDPATFEGSERWYSFSLRPGAEQAWADTWHLVLYWEGNPVYQSVFSMVVVGQQLQVHTFVGGDTQHWAGPFTPDAWHDYILHVRWSPDPATGLIELYADGAQVIPPTNVATMHGPGVPNELHTGLLRNDAVEITEVIYVDGVREGATLEDVMGDDGGTTSSGDSDGSSGGDPDDSGGDETGGAGTSGGPGGDDGTGGGTLDGTGDSGSIGSGGSASEGDDAGCGCRSAGSGREGWAWLLWLLVPFVARRRQGA